MSVVGRIHSIETFGAVDGPGVRYIVFMQGCPLRCIYCHNRDTWDATGGKEVTVDYIINDLKKYLDFIRFSNGGITVSGGEPTLQAEFVTELFKKCNELDVHTALDTSGFADISAKEELLKYTDLVLLDIKHGNEVKHKDICGVEAKKIREFGKYVSDCGIDIWIRYVLVPGYTDSEEDLRLAREVIDSLNTVKKVEVLPYHAMGKHKWIELEKEYKLKDVLPPSKEQLELARKILCR